MASHLSALVAIAGLPFGHVVGPLIVYLVKHKESAFVAEHSRSSLNYQITVSIAAILAVIVGIIIFAVVIAVAGVASPHTDDATLCSRRDRIHRALDHHFRSSRVALHRLAGLHNYGDDGGRRGQAVYLSLRDQVRSLKESLAGGDIRGTCFYKE